MVPRCAIIDDEPSANHFWGFPLSTLNDQGTEQAAWLGLGSEYDPGQFVFDYFNDRQLADVAQGLGLDLAQSRQVTRDVRDRGDVKVSLKVLELGGGRDRGAAEAATHAGAMHTATLIEILVRLRQAARLHALAQTSLDGPSGMLAACRAAASNRSWVIVDGDWVVSEAGLSLRLIRAAGAERDFDAGDINVEAEIPALREELMPTGRTRLVAGRTIAANVFGHIETWAEDDKRLTITVHAEFARIGDPRFSWSGASFGDNSDGDF
jgi:hypothetical protein